MSLDECHLYLKSGKIDLDKPPVRPRLIPTKNVIKPAQKRFQRKIRQSLQKMTRQLRISERSLDRIVQENLGLHAYRITIQLKLTDVQKHARVRVRMRVETAIECQTSDGIYLINVPVVQSE